FRKQHGCAEGAVYVHPHMVLVADLPDRKEGVYAACIGSPCGRDHQKRLQAVFQILLYSGSEGGSIHTEPAVCRDQADPLVADPDDLKSFVHRTVSLVGNIGYAAA